MIDILGVRNVPRQEGRMNIEVGKLQAKASAVLQSYLSADMFNSPGIFMIFLISRDLLNYNLR